SAGGPDDYDLPAAEAETVLPGVAAGAGGGERNGRFGATHGDCAEPGCEAAGDGFDGGGATERDDFAGAAAGVVIGLPGNSGGCAGGDRVVRADCLHGGRAGERDRGAAGAGSENGRDHVAVCAAGAGDGGVGDCDRVAAGVILRGVFEEHRV